MVLLNLLYRENGGLQGRPHSAGGVVLLSSRTVLRVAKVREIKRREVLSVGSSLNHSSESLRNVIQYVFTLGSENPPR
jgi:hypothetical protein